MIAAGTLPATPLASVTDPNGDRWYPYPPTGDLFDSVTTVIGATNSKPWLQKWAGGVSMAWALDNLVLLAAILAGEHVTAEQTVSEAAGKQISPRTAAINLGKDEAERLRQVKADAGVYVHDVMEALVLDVPLPVLPEHLQGALYDGEPLSEVVAAMADGFTQWVADFNPRFLATEMPVYNPVLRVAGTLDMIVALSGYAVCNGVNCHLAGREGCPGTGSHAVPSPGHELVVCVDGKTGRDPEGTWKEQLAAYRRMPECRPDKLDDVLRPTPQTHCGAVLHMRREYPGGYLFMLVAADDDQAAWRRFQKAASIFRERQEVKAKPGRVIRPLHTDGTMPGPRLCDMAAEGYGRALSPLRKALGADCELAELATFTEADVLAVRGVGPKLIDTIREMLAANGLSLADDAPTGKVA